MNLRKRDEKNSTNEEIECIRRENDSERGLDIGNGGSTASEIETVNITESLTEMTDGHLKDEDYIRKYLRGCAWYHGMMFGVVADKLLKFRNCYLVRRAISRTSKKFLCISARIDGKVYNYMMNLNEEGWSCPKLYDKFPKIIGRRFTHVVQLLDAWSLCASFLLPISRSRVVIGHSSIHLENRLGNGAFGEVLRAKYTAVGATESIEVAVKKVIGEGQRHQIQEFCHEARIMATLKHENVVAFYGFASLEDPVMLVMELISGGDLKKYLRTTPNLSKQQIILFALHIACGMRHLSSKKVIHRDLAARNCLITTGLIVKISDFGLSVQEKEVIVKSLKKAPIRWLAPETISKGIFNEKTDVWSYGVVLTELMTKCAHDPLYPRNLRDAQAWIKEAEFPHRIENGDPAELNEIVDSCCDKNPATRINFQTAKRRVAAVYETVVGKSIPSALQSLSLNPTNPISKQSSVEEDRSKMGTVRRVSRTMLSRKRSTDKTSRRRELKLPSTMTPEAQKPSPPTTSTQSASPNPPIA